MRGTAEWPEVRDASGVRRYTPLMSTPRTAFDGVLYDDATATFGDEAPSPASYVCDRCGGTFDGPPEGAGMLVWTRGDEVRIEEPPLCEECARAVATVALVGWAREDDES